MKLKSEKHASTKHNLIEEYALLSQWWDKTRRKLKGWEAELLERYDMMPDTELLAWAQKNLKKEWGLGDLKRNLYRIKIKIGCKEEKTQPKPQPKPLYESINLSKLKLF